MHEFCDAFGRKMPISSKNTIEWLLIGMWTDVKGFNHVQILKQDSNSNKFTPYAVEALPLGKFQA